MSRRKVAFVINPNSGPDKKTDRVALVRALLDPGYDSEIFEWKKIEDGPSIFERVRSGGFDIAMAVGGDGTVSQLADALCGSTVALGILPFGSGNGLARHLGVPMKAPEAMQLLLSGKIETMDRGLVNGRSFFCTAGVGFDAHIGKLFAESSTRGFSTYTKMTLRELRLYRNESYTITFDGTTIRREAFLITAANAGQYGNNAWIAPEAKVNDGILHLTILKPFRWWNIPVIGSRFFNKTVTRSRYVESYTARHIVIKRESEGAAHFDGEPAVMGNIIEISVDPGALKVLVPGKFTG